MFDLGWTEILVVGIVALIVVGPKDLPKMFRTLGQIMAKARAMAREFQRAMDDAADASGVKDVARDFKKATDPQGMGLDEFKNWDPLREDRKPGKSSKSRNTKRDEDEDEAALDRISEEMENLRRERASAKAGNSGGKGAASPTAAAAPEVERAPGATPESKPDAIDGPEGKTP